MKIKIVKKIKIMTICYLILFTNFSRENIYFCNFEKKNSI
jgi:hypothetical protein